MRENFLLCSSHLPLGVSQLRALHNIKYVLKDLSIGSGSIIGRDNIEEFFNHVSKHKDVEDKSLVELAPDYETDAVCLV